MGINFDLMVHKSLSVMLKHSIRYSEVAILFLTAGQKKYKPILRIKKSILSTNQFHLKFYLYVAIQCQNLFITIQLSIDLNLWLLKRKRILK